MNSNDSRKIILEKIDSGFMIKNEQLLMYGLTPYMQDENIDTGLKLLNFKMKSHFEERKLKHDKKISLMPEQAKYLSMMFKHNRIVFKAPTSFGKSLLLKEYIYINMPQTVVYIVPTNSLANELEESYKKTFESENYEIFDSVKSDFKKNIKKKQLFIGTQEKFSNIKHIFENIDIFIIDEAYKLQDDLNNSRNIVLSKSLLEEGIEKANQIFLLLPNAKINNIDEYDFKVLETNFNAVEKQFIQSNNIKNKINTVHNSKEKSIVYFNTPTNITTFLKNINLRNDYVVRDEIFLDHLEREYSANFSVFKALNKGIIIHHGQIPKYLQRRLLNLFNNSNEYNLLFGTRSVSEGINTPTKNIIFHNKVDVSSDKMLIKNTIGRAGRLGKYPIGTIIGSCSQIQELESQEEIEISIAFAEEGNVEKVKTNSRINKIMELLKEYKVNSPIPTNVIEEIEKLNLSLRDMKIILEYFYEDNSLNKTKDGIYFPNNVVYDLANKLNISAPDLYEIDKRILDSMLFMNKKINNIQFDLYTFKDKLSYLENYCIYRKLNHTNTKLIDLYFKHRYSTLEYRILPLIKIVDLLLVYIDSPYFDSIQKNVMDTKFRYARYVMNNQSYFDLSEDEQIIMLRMSEYGIPIRKIDTNFVRKIVERLSIRYSMYDIRKAIETIYFEEKDELALELIKFYL